MSVRLSAIKDLEGTLLPDSFYQLLGLAQDAAPVRVASSYGTSVRALLLRLPLFFFLFFFFKLNVFFICGGWSSDDMFLALS